jgi:hypothetical protein
VNDQAGHLYCSNEIDQDPVVWALLHPITSVAPLYPRQLLESVAGWSANLSCGQDYELNLRLACHGAAFYRMDEVLVTVRRRSDSLSSNYLRVLDEFEGICWNAYRQLQASGHLTDDRARAFATAFAVQARTYLRLGERTKAIARFSQAYQMHPSGGLKGAYRPWTLALRQLIGPTATEKLVSVKRRAIPG